MTEYSYTSLPCPGYEGGDEEDQENQNQADNKIPFPLEATFSGQQSAFKDVREELALPNSVHLEPTSSLKNFEATND